MTTTQENHDLTPEQQHAIWRISMMPATPGTTHIASPITAWAIRNLSHEQQRRALWLAARMGQRVTMNYDNDIFGHSAKIAS